LHLLGDQMLGKAP